MITRKESDTIQLRITLACIEEMKKKGRRLNKIYETECNRDLTKREETMMINLENAIMDAAAQADMNVYIQSDPRGGTVYISYDSIDRTNYTQGICLI